MSEVDRSEEREGIHLGNPSVDHTNAGLGRVARSIEEDPSDIILKLRFVQAEKTTYIGVPESIGGGIALKFALSSEYSYADLIKKWFSQLVMRRLSTIEICGTYIVRELADVEKEILRQCLAVYLQARNESQNYATAYAYERMMGL